MPDPRPRSLPPSDRTDSRDADGWDDGLSLREHVWRQGPLDAGSLHRVAIASAAALASLHGNGVVHGDLGPDTIVLGPGGLRVVGTRLTKQEQPASPAADGQPTTGQARDMFAWAVTMTFAAGGPQPQATGVPADGDAGAAGPAIPGALRAVLQECMGDLGLRPTAQQVVSRLSRTPAPAPVPGSGRAASPARSDVPTAPIPAQGSAGGRANEASRRQPPARPPGRGSGADTAGTVMMPAQPAVGGRRLPSSQPPPDEERSFLRRQGSGRTAVLALLTLVVVATVTSMAGRGQLSALFQGAAGRQARPAGTAAGPATAGAGQASIPSGPTPAAALTGQWQGALAQSNSPNPLTVQVSFDGRGGGQIVLPRIGCTGRLTPTQARTDSTVFHDQLINDLQGGCARAGTVTITRLDTGNLRLRWVNSAAPFNSAAGVLRPA